MSKKLIGSFVLGLVLVLSVFLAGCAGDITTQTVTVTVGSPTTGSQDFQSFGSTKYYLDEKEPEVLPKLVNFINSGQHDIIEVDVTYSNQYLTSAIVRFVPNTTGEGSNLRIKVLTSDQYYYDQRAPEIQKQLDAVRQSGLDIYRVDPVYDQGYLVAGIVWYKAQ